LISHFPAGWRKETPALALLLAALVGLLAFTGSNWRYTALGGMDNWSYVGYAKHYADPEYRAGLYKSCRLPWIWWQYAVRNLFPGEPGSRALCATLLLAWAGAWYYFARQFAEPALAALLGAFALLYLPGHGPGGWDYHNMAAGVFLVLAMAVSARIAKEQTPSPRLALFLGVFLALALHTNITLVNVLPAMGFFLWPAFRPFQPRRLAVAAGWVLAGGIFATVLLGVVNVSVGRRPFFYWKMVETVLHFVGDSSQQAPWYQPLGGEWMSRAHYLAFPLAASGFAIFCLGRGVRGDARRLCLLHLFLCAAWLGWHALGQTALNIDYFAYPLSLTALPLLLVAARMGAGGRSLFAPALFAVAGIFCLAFGGWVPAATPPGPLVLQILLFFLGLFLLWLNRGFFWLAGLLLLAGANGVSPQAALYANAEKTPDLRQAHTALLGLQDWAWPLRNERPRPPSPSLATVLSGHSFQTDPLAHLIWNPDPANPLFGAFVVSLGSTDFEMSFPGARRRAIRTGAATGEDFSQLKPGMCLFVAEESGDHYADAVKKNLQRLGIPFQAGADREIRLNWGAVRLERILFL